MRALKAEDFVSLDVPEEEFRVAKEIANYYRAKCKVVSPWANPFNPAVPVELQGIFKHFHEASKLVIEFRCEARDLVDAQFEGLAWAKRIPYPMQLYTDNARLRLITYLQKRGAKQEKVVTEDDFQHGRFELEERRALKLAKQLGVSTKRALREMPREFSKAYLQHMGVWSLVRDAYEGE